MEEILNNNQIKWDCSVYFILKDDKLFKVDKWNQVPIGEIYCSITQSPSTPPDFGLISMRKGSGLNGFEQHQNSEFINSVINFDYLEPEHIKNFIKGEGEFLNYWDEKYK
jgi:hypothetical protein